MDNYQYFIMLLGFLIIRDLKKNHECILLMISNDTLGKSLSDGVDLRSESRTSDSDSNIEVSESLSSEEKDRLVDLSLEELGVNKIDGRSVDLEESLSGSNGSNGNGVFLSAEGLDQLGLLLLLTHLCLAVIVT